MITILLILAIFCGLGIIGLVCKGLFFILEFFFDALTDGCGCLIAGVIILVMLCVLI